MKITIRKKILLTIIIPAIFAIALLVIINSTQKEIRYADTRSIVQEYRQDIAFSSQKAATSLTNSFIPIYDNEYAVPIHNFFKSINMLEINADAVKSKYDEIKDQEYAIYSVNYHENSENKQFSAETLDDLLVKVKASLSYESKFEDLTYNYTKEERDQLHIDSLIRWYLKPLINNKTIINLGSYVIGSASTGIEIKDIPSVITQPQIYIVDEQKVKVQEDLTQVVNSVFRHENTLYYIEYINNDTNIWVYSLQDLGIDSSEIKVKDVNVEYILLPKSRSLVPVLRFDGEITNSTGTPINLSFWVWFIQ